MNIIDSIITFTSYILKPEKRSLIKHALKLKGKTGLEIGGPTPFFSLRGGFPIYLFAKRIDGVNFSDETIWEGQIKQGYNYNYYKKNKGYQYIAEATELKKVSSISYDFVLSSHCLEHVANPIKALKEWCRVLKVRGNLILILPDKDNTFDQKRSYTTFEHILADYLNNTTEGDTTHFPEILKTCDEEKSGLTYAEWELMLSNNIVRRFAHHHVFDVETIKQIVEYSGFDVQCQCKLHPFHLITIASKQP
jgi:ubiquinone/menaquinone biosynthesis C-methylase UbiE